MNLHPRLHPDVGFDKPHWPFLMMFFSPVLTLPITGGIIAGLPDCGLDEPWWELRHMRLALLPGLVDLLLFAWLLSGKLKVRLAAVVAGVIGIFRVGFPQVLLSIYVTSSGGQAVDPSCSVSSFLLVWMILAMLGVWAASTLIGATVLHRITRGLSDS